MHHLDNADRLADSYELARSACAVDQLSPGVQRGCEPYEPQLAAIRAAKHSVYLEAYIFYSGHSADAFLAALRERAKAGVAVRVIIDAVGSFLTPKCRFAALTGAGGQVHRYHPLHWHMLRRWNRRTHRNLLLLDGQVPFIGGAGIADHWSHAVSRCKPVELRICCHFHVVVNELCERAKRI